MNASHLKFAALTLAAALSPFGLSPKALHAEAHPSASHEKGHDKEPDKSHSKRNVILFIADGLRHGSVNPTDAPTLLALRQMGVHFVNSHSIFPTFTTANASVMATGHLLGDTGDFSNTLHPGYAIFNTGNFGKPAGTLTPFVENDQVLGDLDDHFNGNYLNEETILSIARKAGYNTAAIGKVGPVAIFDVSQLEPSGKQFQLPMTVIIDDATGSPAGVPLPSTILSALTAAGLPTTAPGRTNGASATSQQSNGFSGNNTTPGTLAPNLVQQQYFVDTLTKAVLPTFLENGQPFVAVYWSRDPDGSQHNQGDSLNSLTPGINGPTSKAAVKNADNNLKQILDFFHAHPSLIATTDLVITSDHGFSTISKHEVDAAQKTFVNDYASRFIYKDATGRQEVNTGFLPVGFLSIDLAHHFSLPLYDPDNQVTGPDGVTPIYEPVDPTIPQQTATVRQHAVSGNGVIGGTGQIPASGESKDAKIIVAANGGSDLIYVPDHNPDTVKELVAFLRKQNYTGGLFVDDAFGPLPGSLPLSAIGLKGDTPLPTPAIAINFKNFALDPRNPNQTRVEIADSSLQQGQGMHGSFSRADTYNNMAAIGPDFKHGFTDQAPVSNADLARTIAKILNLDLPSNGHLTGRLLREALAGKESETREARYHVTRSLPGDGKQTLLVTQSYEGVRYYDAACLVPFSDTRDDSFDDHQENDRESSHNPCN